MKLLQYHTIAAVQYFWRTTQQQEIDLIEELGEQLIAYEFKRNKNAKVRFPHTFTDNYPGSKTFTVSLDNMENFLLQVK